MNVVINYDYYLNIKFINIFEIKIESMISLLK